MDNLTHGLIGALIGQAGLKTKTGLAMPALIIGANLPDIDAACFFWLDGAEHLGFRRGITHGPIAWVVLPLILAALLWGWDRWQERRGKPLDARAPVHFGWLYGLSLIGCLTHPALDWLNVYGIRLLEPFSSRWFYGDTLFIIDVWLWALLIAGVWWSRRQEKRDGEWRRLARIVALVALVYIGLNGVWSASQRSAVHSAIPTARTIISSPVALNPFLRENLVELRPGVWGVMHQIPSNENSNLPERLTPVTCRVPTMAEVNSDEAKAFLFWSRAPFAERAEDGSVTLRDARFYDPRARDRFSVALPGLQCEELPAD